MLMIEHVGRALQTRSERTAQPAIAAPEAADFGAIFVVPLGHPGRMVAELVATRTDVPGLGNQFDARQDRILHHGIEEARAGIETAVLASKRCAQVEAKAIDVIVRDPMTQGIERQLDHAPMRKIYGI